MIENNSEKHMRLFEVCFLLYATWYFLPAARGFFWGGVWNALFFALYLAAIALAFLQNLKLEINPLTGKAALPIFLYMALFILYCLLDISYATAHVRVSFTFWGTFIFFMLTEKYPESQKRIAKYLLIMFLITYATTFLQLVTDGSVARMLTDASVETELRRSEMLKNIGDIYVVQMSVLFVPFLMDVLLFRTKKWYYKFLGLAVLALEFYFIMSASFTIALLVFVATVILSFVFLAGKNNAMDTMIKLILALIAVILVTSMDWANIFGSLANSIPNEFIAQRFRGLQAMFTSGLGASDASSRPILYRMSIQTFFRNFWGVGPNYSYMPGDQGIGMHSQFFDDLARYGVLALGFYIMFFVRFYRMLYQRFKEIGRERIVLPTVLVYVMFLCVNIGFRSPYESILMMFVFPSIPYFLKKGGENKTELKEGAES